ncbi:MAG: hypothetical protein EOM91_18735 [Sphingobacteriia bacterium]|nr:hypothetical protein [Sphingobacteriia bacterium]
MAEKPSTQDPKPEPVTHPSAQTAEPTSDSASAAVTLDEFCARLSERVRKIPLISGFAADCRAAGHLRDTEAAYQAAFDAFRNRSA